MIESQRVSLSYQTSASEIILKAKLKRSVIIFVDNGIMMYNDVYMMANLNCRIALSNDPDFNKKTLTREVGVGVGVQGTSLHLGTTHGPELLIKHGGSVTIVIFSWYIFFF